MKDKQQCIAYIAPEIPGLSATFVYNEILALERKGYLILPISIHKPSDPAIEMQSLSDRTIYLYSEGLRVFLWAFFIQTILRPHNMIKGLRWLISDIINIGVLRKNSWKLIFQYCSACHLSRLLIKNNCDHIHVHFAHVPAQVGMYTSALANINYSITSHANDIFERGILLKAKAVRSNCFATISKYNRDYLITQGVPEEKIVIIRCGVSFIPYELKKTCARKSTFRMGSLGRLVEKKGMPNLLHAARRIKDHGFNFELIIAGDGPLKAELRNITEQLEIQNNVYFVGALDHSSVAEWLHNLDVFVLACQKDSNGDMDGIPVVLMEAMSQGVPVISTYISGIPELIKHRETGLLSEPNDIESLANQIIELINDSDLSRRLAENGKRYVHSEFGISTNIKRLESCFNRH